MNADNDKRYAAHFILRELVYSSIFIGALAVALKLVVPSAAAAQTMSRPCPFDCDTQKIPRSQCKDWREGTTCYVEDLRPGRTASGRADAVDSQAKHLNRKVSMVSKALTPGNSATVELDDNIIERIDVVARRQGDSTDTQVALLLEDQTQTGAPQQLDSNSNTVLRWQVANLASSGRELLVKAIDGDVFVESVHVFYQK